MGKHHCDVEGGSGAPSPPLHAGLPPLLPRPDPGVPRRRRAHHRRPHHRDDPHDVPPGPGIRSTSSFWPCSPSASASQSGWAASSPPKMLLPMGKAATTAYGCIAALVFSGFIIYDTDNLIKRHTYDEYVTAAISLYLYIINIFMAIVTVLSSDD